MGDENIQMELDTHKESWISGWFRWCPTSGDMLREAEKSILTHIRSLTHGKYVDIGCVAGNESSHIWTLRANIESNNTPVVLLHGFGSGSALWCLNIDSIAAHRPVYAIDNLGFGRSSRPKFDTDAIKAERQFITGIEAWRKEMGLDKFIIVGHSFGGFLAASYAIKYPERVAHLILADPWGVAERPLDVEERHKLPIWAKALGSFARHFNPLSVLRAAGPLGPSIVKTARPDLTKKFSSVLSNAAEEIPNYLYHCNAQNPSGETAFHHLMSGFGWAKYPIITRLDSLQKEVSITLIYGSRSWVDRDPGFKIQYSRQDSYVDVQILQGAGHHVYADRAERFNSIINRVGNYTDQGSLPPSPSTVRGESGLGSSPSSPPLSVAESLSKFINVRQVNTSSIDEEENDGEKSDAQTKH